MWKAPSSFVAGFSQSGRTEFIWSLKKRSGVEKKAYEIAVERSDQEKNAAINCRSLACRSSVVFYSFTYLEVGSNE